MCLAIPGKIISIQESELFGKMGKISFEGIIKEISLSLLPDSQIGQYVMVHVGFAISLVDEEEARLTLDTLRRMDELAEHVEEKS